jgi:hypothetical protein
MKIKKGTMAQWRKGYKGIKTQRLKRALYRIQLWRKG